MLERALTAALPAVVLAALAWASGGYYPETWGAILLVEAIAVAVYAIVAMELEVSRRGAVLVGGLLALAVWQLVSRGWAVDPDGSVLEAERTLVYAGAAAAALLLVPQRLIDELVLGFLAGIGLVTVGGLGEHVLGSGTPNDRLELPIGYANAAGILAATAVVLGLGLAADGPVWRRGLGAGLGPPAAAALYLSLSRGAFIACAVGVVVLATTVRPRASLARVALAAGPTALAGVAIGPLGSFGEPGVTGNEVVSLAAVAGLTAVAAGVAVGVHAPAGADRRRVAVAGIAALVLVAGVGAVVRKPPEVVEGPSQPATAGRLVSSSTSFRTDYWEVAAGMVGDAPLLGRGAGGFERVWLHDRSSLVYVRDAHNVYLETLAELGPVGLVALLFALAAPLTRIRRLSNEAVPRAALAAYVVVLAHAAVDWDWELPAVMGCAILLGVTLVKAGGPGRIRALRTSRRAALLAAAGALGVAAVVAHGGNNAIVAARDALDRGDAVEAKRQAERARGFAPWSAEPWRLLGEAEAAAGDLAPARAHIRRAIREDPDAWESWLALAFATDGPERERAVSAARALNALAPELAVLEEADP